MFWLKSSLVLLVVKLIVCVGLGQRCFAVVAFGIIIFAVLGLVFCSLVHVLFTFSLLLVYNYFFFFLIFFFLYNFFP